MIKHRCSQCGVTYSSAGYDDLDRQPVNPDGDDPMKGSGYERVCGECGAGFYTDKWTLRETVETPDGEVTVSTVALPLAHGLNDDQWFETCLFHDAGSRVTDRYHTQDEAEDGHEHRVEQVRGGRYQFVPTGRQIEFEEADDD